MVKTPLPGRPAFRLARLIVTLIAVAAFFTGLYVPPPTAAICHGVAIVGLVMLVVLTWWHVLYLRRRIRDLKADRQV